jgi:hypothetical protein
MPDSVKWNGDAFDREIGRVVRRRLLTLARHYERIVQELFRLPKSGRLYGAAKAVASFARRRAQNVRARPRGRVHQASAPGEAPAIDTAALSKSVTHELSLAPGEASVTIGVTEQGGRKNIAGFLEFGTATIQPRPVWRPALERLRAEAEGVLESDDAAAALEESNA